jgi:activating signal cointegrator complex subunit 2
LNFRPTISKNKRISFFILLYITKTLSSLPLKTYFFSSIGTLDEKFKDCDEQETYIPAETPDKVYAATGLERTNVYDGDKFDVMRIENFSGDVLKNGKSILNKEPKSYADLINDKSHISEMRSRYKQYSLITENDSDADREYDDEFDDSYDVFADTEPRIYIRGKMRDSLPDNIDLSESESEEELENEQPKRNPLDFCENPEIIRARREQQFRNRMAKKHPNKPISTGQPSKDFVGNTKGLGQSNEVLRNRQQKSANKSSRANHNRKAGSSFKQSRGMY